MTEPVRPHPLDAVPALARAPLALVLAAIPIASLYALASWARWAPIVAAPLITPLVVPFLTPLLATLRIFRYRSRFLLLLPRLRGGFAMHLGTGIDFLLYGRSLSNVGVIASVIEGLIAIGDDVTSQRLRAETVLEATSDVLSPRTAKMLGFDVAPATISERVTFAIGWLDASLWRSLRMRRFTPSVLSRVITARTTAGRLAAERPRLLALLERLRSNAV